MFKKLLKFIGIFIAIFAGIIAVIFSTTSGLPETTEEILEQLKQGNIEQVYENSTFPESATLEEFQLALGIDQTYDLSKAKLISWIARGFQNSGKYITGDFSFLNGETITITFWFIKEEGEYKLTGFHEGTPQN